MTAAYRMKGLGWFFCGVVVAIAFLLVSLQVAAERKRVFDLDGAIARAKRDIRMLETEFNTRANLAQLEKWNGDVLALAAPRADQFMDDSVQLAQVDFSVPGAHGGPVRAAAYVVPALHPLPGLDLAVDESPNARVPGVVPVAPYVAGVGATASPVRPVPAMAGAAAGAAATRLPMPRLASATAAAATRAAISRAASVDAPATRRSAAIALLDRKLLSDSTLDDLMATARAEARRR